MTSAAMTMADNELDRCVCSSFCSHILFRLTFSLGLIVRETTVLQCREKQRKGKKAHRAA